MPNYTFTLSCPNCGADVQVPFGNRADDQATVLWRHNGCPNGGLSRRASDWFTTSLPTDGDGNLLPPDGE